MNNNVFRKTWRLIKVMKGCYIVTEDYDESNPNPNEIVYEFARIDIEPAEYLIHLHNNKIYKNG